jgi:membrane fusion protein
MFRKQVRDHADNAWLGRIVLVRPPSFALLSAIAGAFALLLIAFFFFGEYTRKARVSGVLVPTQGVIKILAQQAGVVEAVHAIEGRAVEKDAPLVVVGDARSANDRDVGAAVAARLADKEKAIEQQREHAAAAMRMEQAALELRRDGLAREIDRLDAELDAQLRRSKIAGDALARAVALERTGFVSIAALDHERDATLDQQARLESLRRTQLSLEREMSSVGFDMQVSRSRARSQLAVLEGQRASLEQEKLERALQYRAAIVAPAAGTVATVLVQAGQMVTPGTALVAIIPADATLEAQLFLPSRSIGFVHAGEEVLLRYLAFPHQKFGMHRATITAVARNPMLPGELGFTPSDGAREPLYRVKASLDAQAIAAYGRLEPLQAGMQFEADILLDRRRLIEWIFEPLLSLAGRA